MKGEQGRPQYLADTTVTAGDPLIVACGSVESSYRNKDGRAELLLDGQQ